jgi:hypothetical protein
MSLSPREIAHAFHEKEARRIGRGSPNETSSSASSTNATIFAPSLRAATSSPEASSPPTDGRANADPWPFALHFLTKAGNG